MKIWMNGNLVEQKDATVSVFDHGLLYGDGVFEGIRAYGGKIFQCEAHLDRLMKSADAINLKVPYGKPALKKAMYEAMEANSLENCYFRLVVTRGPGSLGISPYVCKDSVVFIIADQIEMYTEEMYENGIGIIVAKTTRIHSSMMDLRVKSLNYLNNVYAKMECAEAGVPEALMLNTAGNICEATGDNVFIIKDGKLLTPPASSGILLGITRGVVMHLAQTNGIEVLEQDMTVDDVYSADECFLTGTGAEVIAVTAVDGHEIGEGVSGPITAKLLKLFREFTTAGEELPYRV